MFYLLNATKLCGNEKWDKSTYYKIKEQIMKKNESFIKTYIQAQDYMKTYIHSYKNGQMDAHIDRVTYIAGDEVTEFAVIPLNLR